MNRYDVEALTPHLPVDYLHADGRVNWSLICALHGIRKPTGPTVNWITADRLAVRLCNMHPGAIWPQWWTESVPNHGYCDLGAYQRHLVQQRNARRMRARANRSA